MDQVLDRNWRCGRSPFAGNVLVTLDEPLSLLQTLGILRVCRDVLRSQFANATLFALDDWHGHDGLVTPRRPIDWESIDEALSDERALAEICPADAYVHCLIADENLAFCLRAWCDHDDEVSATTESGADLSATDDVLDAVASALTTDQRTLVNRLRATDHFRSRWAG